MNRNMKKTLTSIFTVVVLVTIIGLNFGCESTKAVHLSGDKFVEQANQIPLLRMSSFAWSNYIGETHGRAYIEFGHPAFIGDGQIVKIYWTETSDLPPDFAQKLKKGIYPWEEEDHSEVIDQVLDDVPGLRINLEE